MKRTHQPKLYQGIVIFAGGLLCFLLFLLTLLIYVARGFALVFYTAGLTALAVSIWFIIWGIMYLHNYRMSALAKEKGRPSECVVLSKRITHSRLEVFFQVFVKYHGDKSGLDYEHVVNATEAFYTEIRIGDKIRCSVYEDSCYVDPDFPSLVA